MNNLGFQILTSGCLKNLLKPSPYFKCSSCANATRLISNSSRRQSSSTPPPPTATGTGDKNEDLEKHRAAIMAKGLPKKKPIDGVNHVVLVASGKGGVGKSTVAVNLAVALKQEYPSRQIGLLDADVYGPSLPIMMNLSGKEPETNSKNLMVPLVNHGVKCMSMGFLVKDEAPVVWRGLMVMQAIERLIRGVEWGPMDTLVIDMPPGTGDTQLSIAQSVVVDGAVIVTTPQQVAVQDAVKGAKMFLKTDVDVIGFVVNMATYHCPACKINSRIGSKSLAKLKSYGKIIGELPFDLDISACCDEGTPIVLQHQLYTTEFGLIARSVMKKLNEKKKDKARKPDTGNPLH